VRSWLAWEAGCLAEFVFWWLVVPAAVAFIWLVLFAGDLVVVSTWLYGIVIAVLVVASLVVLCTALFGHLRAKKMAAVVKSEVNEANPLTRASHRSVERADSPAHFGRSVSVMRDFTVTKEYFEDIIDVPSEQGHGEEYRYWDYTFDFGNRAYRARVYTDEPERASVFRTDSSDFPLDDPPEREQLRAIRSHLEAEPLPRVDGRHTQILVFGKSDAYVWAGLDG
jgi:hypothetical protein